MKAAVAPLVLADGFRHTVPKASRTGVVVSALRYSRTFALAVDVYRRHRRDAAGRCQTCTTSACRSRAHAAKTLRAAGENPADFDVAVHMQPGQSRQARLMAVLRGSTPAAHGRTRPGGSAYRAPRPRTSAAVAKGSTVSVHLVDPVYPLRGYLHCVCGQPFFPQESAEGTRTYTSLCGCRLRPIDATTVERRVQAEADLILSSSTVDHRCAVPLASLFSRIEVGGTVEDIRLLRHP